MIVSGEHNTFALDEKFSARVKVVLWQHAIHHGDVTKLVVTSSWRARVRFQTRSREPGFESLLCRFISFIPLQMGKYFVCPAVARSACLYYREQ